MARQSELVLEPLGGLVAFEVADLELPSTTRMLLAPLGEELWWLDRHLLDAADSTGRSGLEDRHRP